MKAEKLLELPLKEVLNKYSVAYSPECGKIWGIVPYSIVKQVFNEYLQNEELSVSFEPLMSVDMIAELDSGEILTKNQLELIFKNLGISKKQG